MSFAEAQQFSDFEEERNKGTAEKAADGTEVGTPDSQKLDTADKKDEKNERPFISPEEYGNKQKETTISLQKAAKDKPELLSVKEQGPEAIAQANLELNDGWPA